MKRPSKTFIIIISVLVFMILSPVYFDVRLGMSRRVMQKARNVLEAEIGQEANEYRIDSCKKLKDRTLITFIGDSSVLGDDYTVVLNNDGTSEVYEGE